jgi:uncharacterized protein (TIGR00661 family)
VFGGGDALPLLRSVPGFQPVAVDRAGPRFFMRVSQDLVRLYRDRPDILISDGDAPCLVAARMLRIPTVSVGHGLVFTRCSLPEGLPARAVSRERLRALFATRLGIYAVATHFLPIEPSDRRTRVARPVPRESSSTAATTEAHVACYFRDRNGRAAVEFALQAGAAVHCFCEPRLQVAGADCFGFDAERFAESLRSCTAIIGSSGSNLCAEAVMLGKPMLALHRRGDSEQLLNGLLLTRAGIGMAAEFESLRAETVREFLDRAGAGNFRQVDLMHALPDTVTAVLQTLDDIAATLNGRA